MRHTDSFAKKVYRRMFQRPEEDRLADRLDTLGMRIKWINELESVFDMATLIAKGEITQQQVSEKFEPVTSKERQRWAHVAANIASVMGSLTNRYDERQIDKDLDFLEKWLKEVKENRFMLVPEEGSVMRPTA